MKSVVCAGIVTIGLALPVLAGERTPDYTATTNVVGDALRVHKGAMRLDSSVRGGVASEYDAPGQRSRIQVFRSVDGTVNMVIVTGPSPARLAPANAWRDVGEHEILAGERCEVQQEAAAKDASNRRCVTPDGVVLAFQRDYRQVQVKSLKREPVSPRAVKAPIELLDPKHWGLPASLVASPPRKTDPDYEASFEHEGGLLTIRRSGAWTSKVRTGPQPSITLVNEKAGTLIDITGSSRLQLRLRRATKERGLWPFPGGATSVNGRETEVIQGETCHWHAQPIDIDASDLECRAQDGAVLAVGVSGVGGERFSLPRSFVRKPVPLASIMPDPAYFTLERYEGR